MPIEDRDEPQPLEIKIDPPVERILSRQPGMRIADDEELRSLCCMAGLDPEEVSEMRIVDIPGGRRVEVRLIAEPDNIEVDVEV